MAGIALVLGGLLAGGCGVPSDPEGTLERVRGGTMRVGVSESDPWVKLDGPQPGGVEPALVRRFARQLGADVEWFEGSESALLAALHERELDLVVGGLTMKGSPWDKQAALTRPYVKTGLVVGLPAGMRAPADLEGVSVAAEQGDEAAGLLQRKTRATVVRVESLAAQAGRPAAAGDWQLGHLRLRPSDVQLRQDEHIMAMPLGENAWQSELERFLLSRSAEVERVLEREGRP